MPKSATTRSQVIEQETESSVIIAVPAIFTLLLALFALWMSKLINGGNYAPGSVQLVYLLPLCYLIFFVGVLATAALGIRAAFLLKKVHDQPVVKVPCPYCDFQNEFVATPTLGYECESCNRRVHYEDGKPVPIIEVTCTYCKSVHKISSKATQFTCDKCNRGLRLTDPKNPTGIVTEQSDVLANYDVKLTDPGRNATAVAMELQNILVCNLKEARVQMQNLPLTIARNIPERKADAIRRKLRELGATAVIVKTESSEPAGK